MWYKAITRENDASPVTDMKKKTSYYWSIKQLPPRSTKPDNTVANWQERYWWIPLEKKGRQKSYYNYSEIETIQYVKHYQGTPLKREAVLGVSLDLNLFQLLNIPKGFKAIKKYLPWGYTQPRRAIKALHNTRKLRATDSKVQTPT